MRVARPLVVAAVLLVACGSDPQPAPVGSSAGASGAAGKSTSGGSAGTGGAASGSSGASGGSAGTAGVAQAGSSGAPTAGTSGAGGEPAAGSAGAAGQAPAGAAGGGGASGEAGSPGAAGQAGAGGAIAECPVANVSCACGSSPGTCTANGCACEYSTVIDQVVPCADYLKLHPKTKNQLEAINLDCADQKPRSQCHVVTPGVDAATWATLNCAAPIGSVDFDGSNQVRCCYPEIPDVRTDCIVPFGSQCSCPDGLRGLPTCLRPKGEVACDCRHAEPRPDGDTTGICEELGADGDDFRKACTGEPLLSKCRIAAQGGAGPAWRAAFCKKTSFVVPHLDNKFDVFCCRPDAP